MTLEVRSDSWLKGEEVTLCEGAADCGTFGGLESFARDTVATLPMRIEACTDKAR